MHTHTHTHSLGNADVMGETGEVGNIGVEESGLEGRSKSHVLLRSRPERLGILECLKCVAFVCVCVCVCVYERERERERDT